MAAATQEKVIRIRIDSSGAQSGANQVRSSLASIANGTGAANGGVNRLTMSLGGLGNATARTAANSNALGSAFGSLNQTAGAAMSRLSGMGGVIGSIGFAGAALGATALVGGLVALGSAAVEASAKFQSYKASLSTVLGDSEKASQAFDKLTQFAAKTPFSLDQSVQGFIKLKALGLTPSEQAMMSYGNTASAMGKDLNQMIEAVADAATGEFERLKEFGIKSKNQGDTVAFTFQGVTTTVKNNSAEIQKYLMGIGETNFGGAMEKQMGTFNGAMSNLEDTWTQTLAAIGDAGLTDSIGRVINMISNGITTITPLLVATGNVMSGVIDGIASIATGVGQLFAGITTNGGQGITFLEGLTATFNIVGQTAQVVGNIIGASIGAAGQIIGGVIGTVKGWFASFFNWLGVTSSSSTANMGLSFIGILRAAKYVTENLPKMFSAALGAIGGAFGVIGRRIAAFFQGDWNAFSGIGGDLAAQFAGASKVIGGIATQATKIAQDSKGAAAAYDRLLGRTGKKDGGPSLADLAGAAPKPAPSAGGKGDKDKAKEAADRAKREGEFWQTLKDQTTAAGMLALEGERYNKGLELRKILGRDLTADERTRVNTALAELDTAKAITSLRQAQFEAANEYTVELGRAKGLTDAQRSVEDAIFKRRLDALNRGVDINSTAYKQAEDQLAAQLAKNAALKAQNDLLAKAVDFAKKYSTAFADSFEIKDIQGQRDAFLAAFDAGTLKDAFGQSITPAMRDAVLAGADAALAEIARRPLASLANSSITARAEIDRQRAGDDFNTAKANLEAARKLLSPETYAQVSREIAENYDLEMSKANRLVANDYLDRMTDAINDIGDLFGGKIGDAINDIADALQKVRDLGDPNNGFAKGLGMISDKLGAGFTQGAQNMGDFSKGLKGLGDPLKSLKEGFSGKDGSIVKGIGQAVGGAMAGYQMGSAIGGLGQALGMNKGFNSGAKIGGTIGGITGNPIIAAGASVIGGLIGSLFHKPKYGTASLTGAGDPTITGNKGSAKAAAGDAAGAVQSGLANIASALGGMVGNYSLAIGTYDGKWRVRDDAYSGKLKFKGSAKNGLHDFGKDGAEAAIAYAIKNAISDGAIQGISDFAKKALNALDPDAAIALVQSFKAITDELDAMNDPIGAAVRAINTPLDSLVKQMQAVGASSTDLAKIEEYRSKKLDAALKEQLSGLNSFLDALKGEGSGVSKLDRLNADLAKFAEYQTRIKAGDSTVDQGEFTNLGQSIFGLARDVYGTATSQFQDIRAMLTSTTEGLSSNVTDAFNTAAGRGDTTSAVQAGAQAMVSEQVITNDLLRQLLAQQQANDNGYQTPNGYQYYARNGTYQGPIY